MAKDGTRNTQNASTARQLVPQLLGWFAANARDLPWRRTRDPYAIWVSEVMLQQTQVKTVIPYWGRWMRELPTIESLARAKPAKIHKLWEGLGYYTRVRNMQQAAQQIMGRERGDESPTNANPPVKRASHSAAAAGNLETHLPLSFGRGEGLRVRGRASTSASIVVPGSTASPSPRPSPLPKGRGRQPVSLCQFPDNFDDILALPGIGRYTAGAIASIAFNQPAPILDGNVIRVLTRLHGMGEDPQEKKTNARLWQLAEELVRAADELTHHAPRTTPEGIKSKSTIKIRRPPACSHLNQSLMELGALICTPRSPNCAACPVAKCCVALRDNRIDELPRPKERAAVTPRRFFAFVVEHKGRFLVRQRAAGVVNAHLWEFPNVEAPTGRARHSVRAALKSWMNGAQGTDAPYQADKFQLASPKPVCVVKHSITRYRMTTEAYRITITGPRPKPGIWRTPAQLGNLALTSAHRQIAIQFGIP